jgi:hypothetical protein
MGTSIRFSRVVALTAFGCGASLFEPAAAASPDGLDVFVGAWSCAGHFTANNQPISAHLAISRDAATNALLVRHDDDPPFAYHALEMWTAMKSGGLRASIADAFTGMRWFAADGWNGSTLTWRRPAGGAVEEQFSYVVDPKGDLRVDWSTAGKDGTMVVGDTIACRKSGSSPAG